MKASKPKCKKPYAEWNLVALAVAEPNPGALLPGLPKGNKLEVLASG